MSSLIILNVASNRPQVFVYSKVGIKLFLFSFVHSDNILFLLLGASVNQANSSGDTPLIIAAQYADQELIRTLMQYGQLSLTSSSHDVQSVVDVDWSQRSIICGVFSLLI